MVAAVGHRRLHSGDARVPQSSSTIEGGEGGGAPTFVSGSERCLPRSCKLLMHFRENGTGGGRCETIRVAARPPPRNHLSSLEESGRGGGFHTSPTFSAARESIAVISGSGSDNATTPEGCNAAESTSPERERESPPMQQSTSGHQGEHRRKRGVYPTLRSQPDPASCGLNAQAREVAIVTALSTR